MPEPGGPQAVKTLKPFKVNFADVPWDSYTKGRFGSEDKYLTATTRAKRLDCTLTKLAPGQVSCPYHFNHVGEEMFIILQGCGKVRMDDHETPVGPEDVITCPPGPSGCHQFINDGTDPLVYLAISTEGELDITEYPDSGKFNVEVFNADGETRVENFKRSDKVDYWKDEQL